MNDLNGKEFFAGAAIAGYQWSFTRPSGDTSTDYSNAAIALEIYELDSTKPAAVPLSTTPVLVLSVGSGLARSTNSASVQEGRLTITASQVGTLLGNTAKIKQFSYVWAITPTGAEAIRAPKGSGYDGRFFVIQEGYGGANVVKP